jgi:hypothetical protein
MKKKLLLSAVFFTLMNPFPTAKVTDVHPWNKIASPFTCEREFWKFHYIKLRFPNYAAMAIPNNIDKPWTVTYPIGTKRGREVFKTITIKWKGGLTVGTVKG